MTASVAITTLLVMTGLPIDAATLDGERLSGELQSLSATQAVLIIDGEPREIALSELQEVRPSSAARGDTALPPSQPALRLRDGSILAPKIITAAKQQFVLINENLGEITIPATAVQSLRLALLDTKITAAWDGFLQRDTNDDLVVIRKGDALDHVAGVVSTINEASISLLIDGRAIDLPRERVFGVIYANTKSAGINPLCVIDLTDGQRIAASSIHLNDDALDIETSQGHALTIAGKDVHRIDFSLGKIEFLAAIEPSSIEYPVDHPLYLEEVWKYRRGQNSRGEPLLLDGRHYDNGIWIHSGTVLRYRLGRQYRRFQSLMGIDDDLGDCAPQVGVVIRGDGRVLHEDQVARGDDARELDIDVSDIRELEIEVISTDPNGICEHLDLVEARLIK